MPFLPRLHLVKPVFWEYSILLIDVSVIAKKRILGGQTGSGFLSHSPSFLSRFNRLLLSCKLILSNAGEVLSLLSLVFNPTQFFVAFTN